MLCLFECTLNVHHLNGTYVRHPSCLSKLTYYRSLVCYGNRVIFVSLSKCSFKFRQHVLWSNLIIKQVPACRIITFRHSLRYLIPNLQSQSPCSAIAELLEPNLYAYHTPNSWQTWHKLLQRYRHVILSLNPVCQSCVCGSKQIQVNYVHLTHSPACEPPFTALMQTRGKWQVQEVPLEDGNGVIENQQGLLLQRCAYVERISQTWLIKMHQSA